MNKDGQGMIKGCDNGDEFDREFFAVGNEIEGHLANLQYKHASALKEAIKDLVGKALTGIEEEGKWSFTYGLSRFDWNNGNDIDDKINFWGYDMPVAIDLEFNEIPEMIAKGVEFFENNNMPLDQEAKDYQRDFLLKFLSTCEKLTEILNQSKVKIQNIVNQME